ncbi:hypothetical protein AC578_10308 [Pseudocercospora eumusae]|uniref:Uncharacterized protein n=1 Tax=Pseudocercospora eumusae TaxID=321146 RepID=A0A139HRG0_9PEZI|nr:hypothetical protein AC578_10308 [Pseudocercospora eumusae]KXT05040.1 hypothetical protein AC578_10308 [Pseudocercospora eumusae]
MESDDIEMEDANQEQEISRPEGNALAPRDFDHVQEAAMESQKQREETSNEPDHLVESHDPPHLTKNLGFEVGSVDHTNADQRGTNHLDPCEHEDSGLGEHSHIPEGGETCKPATISHKRLSAFTTKLRDSAIKCKCALGTLRRRKEMVFTGVRDGMLTWMHLPCKPYLAEVPEEMVARIRERIKLVTANPDGLRTSVQMQNILLRILGSNATDEQKRKVANIVATYRCDPPCKGSKDKKDYFCCKKCWAWQHKNCMLYGDIGDHGGPVCNHCYLYFISIQKELKAWQQMRLCSAAKSAFKFIRNPANLQDEGRFTVAEKFLKRLLTKNRGFVEKFVLARRRIQYLVQHRRELKRQAATLSRLYPGVNPGARKAARQKIRRENTPEETPSTAAPSNAVTSATAPSASATADTMEQGTPVNKDSTNAMEVDEDTIVVRPRTPAVTIKATRRQAGLSLQVKKEKTPPPSDSEIDAQPSPLKKKWKFSQKQVSKAPRKSVRQAERPRTYQEPDLEPEWEDEDDDEDQPSSKPQTRARTSSSYEGSTPRQAPSRRNNKTVGDEEDNEEHQQGEGYEYEIACTCVGVMPKLSETFRCGVCGNHSHLKCSRDSLGVPSCAFCKPRKIPKQLRPSQPSSKMPPPAKPKREPSAIPAPKIENTPAPSRPPAQSLSEEMKEEVHQICSTYLWKTWVDIPVHEDEGESKQKYHAADPPPAEWVAAVEAGLVDLLQAAGEEMTRTYLNPVMEQYPRKREAIVKVLREMAVAVCHQGAWKGKGEGKKKLGLFAEIVGFAEKGEMWKGDK